VGNVDKPGRGDTRAERKPRGKRLPWPVGVLFLGVVLAAAAVGLTAAKKDGGEFVFILAVITIVAGIVGLVFHHRREKTRSAGEEHRPRTKVYRHSACCVERPILDRMIKLEAAVAQRAREQRWQLEWAAQQRHHNQAAKLLAEGDLPAAFRESCRALRPLTQALAERRNKEESFQPHWDKT